MSDRRLGVATTLLGLGLALAIQVGAPVRVPLYDGVVVQEPYRYLHPSGDQAGSPTPYAATAQVTDGVSPLFAAATTEGPPQAQLIAQRNAFELTPGATALQISITAVDPPSAQPAEGKVAGNVYRFSVTDQAGVALPIRRCEGCISLVLRAPEDVDEAHLERFAEGTWSTIETIHAGMVSMFSTNPTALGDYAIVTTGPGDEDAGLFTTDRLLLAGGALVILLLAFAAALVLRGRSGPAPAPEPPPGGPSRRKPPRHPPSGRSTR